MLGRRDGADLRKLNEPVGRRTYDQLSLCAEEVPVRSKPSVVRDRADTRALSGGQAAVDVGPEALAPPVMS